MSAATTSTTTSTTTPTPKPTITPQQKRRQHYHHHNNDDGSHNMPAAKTASTLPPPQQRRRQPQHAVQPRRTLMFSAPQGSQVHRPAGKVLLFIVVIHTAGKYSSTPLESSPLHPATTAVLAKTKSLSEPRKAEPSWT